MIDLEKVIKRLEWILENDRFGFGVNWEAGEPRDDYEKAGKIITDTIALLKEQEAVKPTWSRGKPFCGACGLRIHGGKFCSECGKPILWESRLYCINCGQELNWK